MWRIALRSLTFHRGKAIAALCGITFASMLLFVQGGVYAGFLDATAGLITHVGGDVWVMARGTQAVDLAQPLVPEMATVAMSQPCVRRARPLNVTYHAYRTAQNETGNILMIGIPLPEGPIQQGVLPWSLVRGLPQELRGPMHFTLDESSLVRLNIPLDKAIGTQMQIGGLTARLAAVTRGVRAFSTAPIAFMNLTEVTMLDRLPTGSTRFWILDLDHPACAADVIQRINKIPTLQAMTTVEFRKKTESFWIGGTGAGALLAFSSLLGFIVGAVVVGQTLIQITNDHLRELGTLKALGALNREVLLFVIWQASVLAAAGSLAGAVIAISLATASKVLAITLSPSVWILGCASIAVMCALACITSVQKVLRLEPSEVFR